MNKVKENFTIMYNEILNYLSNSNKTIVLDGTQLRFINDAKIIKGEFVALRPSLQTCVSQSRERFIQNNPQATAEQIQEYTQKRTNILHQLNPIMNELLAQVDVLPDIKDSKVSFDNVAIQDFLLENAKINYEINQMSNILKDVRNVKSVSKDKYRDLYDHLLQQIKVKYLDRNLIDNKMNNCIIQILNDIFNYYLYGNKEVPIEVN